MLPPSQLNSLPSAPPFRPVQSPPAANGELVHGVPSHASAFPSQADLPEGCDNPQQNETGFFKNKEDIQPETTATPYMFQPPHYPRALGPGDPLVGTSWENRPYYIDGFAGTMIGDDAIKNTIGQQSGFFTGGRLGWDYDYYWGIESRLGLAWMTLFDKQNVFHDLGNGLIVNFDLNLLYYPWGDSRWRPFLFIGSGISQFDTFGGNAVGYTATLFALPFGVGLKYHMNEWLAWRFDFTDNLCFGDGSLDTMNNISFTAGLEYHFGGHRRNYWPWNPDPKH
jgi:Outer membrane protein beta-barrel domain